MEVFGAWLNKRKAAFIAAGVFVPALFLYALIFPWWNVSNLPIVFTLGAPPDTEILLEVNGESETLPLVPLEPDKDTCWYWTTEIPPRRSYDLSLIFPKAENKIILSSAELIKLSPHRYTIAEWRFHDPEAVMPDNVEVSPQNNGLRLQTGPGGRLQITEDFIQGVQHPIAAFFTSLSNYLLVVLIGCLLIGTGLFFPVSLQQYIRKVSPREWRLLGIIVLASAGAHLFLVARSMPDYWPADSSTYTMEAVSLATEGSFDSKSHDPRYELNRMPGFPLLMAFTMKTFGWNLKYVTVTQATLFVLCIGFLISVLFRFVPKRYLFPAIPLTLLSPPAVWASRQIATESSFAAMWALGIAFYLLYLSADSPKSRRLHLAGFTLAAVAAVAIRPNGILILALPGCSLVRMTFDWIVGKLRLKSRNPSRGLKAALPPRPAKLQRSDDEPSTFHLPPSTFHFLVPFLAVLAFLALWTWRNYDSMGYAKPTDLTEIVHANAPFFAGTFDPRAARDRDDYEDIIRQRHNADYWFHGWGIRKLRWLEVTDHYKDISPAKIQELDNAMAEFNDASRALLPWKAKAAAWWRIAGWGFWFPSINGYSLDAVNRSYDVNVTYPNENLKERIHKNLAWTTRKIDQKFTITPTESSPFIDLYNTVWVSHYTWIYRGLFAAAIFTFAACALKGHWIVSLLLVPYLLNLSLNIYFQYVVARYVQIAEFGLWLTIPMGFYLAFKKQESN